MRNLNKNNARRLEILSPYLDKMPGGLTPYRDLPLETLKTLIAENFVNELETQNDSPSIKEFVEFMEKHPEFLAHGYIIGPERADYRVSIEGLECSPGAVSLEVLQEFLEFSHLSDEITIWPRARSWYD